MRASCLLRCLAVWAIGLLLGAAAASAREPAPRGAGGPEAARWAASWAAAPLDFAKLPPSVATLGPAAAQVESLAGRSWRQRLQPTLGGSRARVRFSNVFGRTPLHIAAATLARGTGGAAVSPASVRALRFGGRPGTVVAPGAEAWSDELRFDIEPAQSVSVSFEVIDTAPIATVHHLPAEGSWTVGGGAAARAVWSDAVPSAWNHVVTGLDVAPEGPARVVVAFGDSITEGFGAGDAAGVATRYPERLAARLQAAPGRRGDVAVVNAGISGNRLLAEGIGPRGSQRVARDIFGQSGVTHAIVLIGINDIGFSWPEGGPPVPGAPSEAEITQGLQQIVDAARSRGVKLLLGTLTPFRGAAYWSEEKESRRQAVNRWIRGRTGVDAVVDFDAVLRDASQPSMLDPRYDSGDHLHPNAAGYAAMADSVDLRELRE